MGHEAVYNRWSFVLGCGMYVARRYQFDSEFYQCFGLRYRVWEDLRIGVGLKAQTFGADFIEWSLGL